MIGDEGTPERSGGAGVGECILGLFTVLFLFLFLLMVLVLEVELGG